MRTETVKEGLTLEQRANKKEILAIAGFEVEGNMVFASRYLVVFCSPEPFKSMANSMSRERNLVGYFGENCGVINTELMHLQGVITMLKEIYSL